MKRVISHLLFTVPVIALFVGCGGDSDSNESAAASVPVRIGLSDAAIGELDSVTITVDSITFNRAGEEDIVVDTFTSSDLDLEDADTFTLDLLEVQGNDNRIVIDSVLLPVGDYQNLRMVIVDEDINFSYVDETESGDRKLLKTPSDELKLGGFTVEDSSTQTFIVEFDLAQAMTYNPGSSELEGRYILKPRGVRVVGLAQAASLSGTVDVTALNGEEPCLSKETLSEGNAAYLYAGHGLDLSLLVDAFDPDVAEDIPEGALNPYSFASLNVDGEYAFSFLEAGDYTLTFTCEATSDDPDIIDGFVIPSPANQWVELTVGEGGNPTCDAPLVDNECASPPL